MSALNPDIPPVIDCECDVPDFALPPLTDRETTLGHFRRLVYGHSAWQVPAIQIERREECVSALRDAACRTQLRVHLSGGRKQSHVDVLLYTPAAATTPVPVFVGLNFFGNHTIHKDPDIFLPTTWCRDNSDFGVRNHRATQAGRGVLASRWPVEWLLECGYGLAVAYHGDLAPDDPCHVGKGALQFFPSGESRGGAIAAWAWGLSRIADALEHIDRVGKLAVVGHSRLGKAALWAGANDDRFLMVFSNNSGCGGAALSRRRFGERFVNINSMFPHWFTQKFHRYNEKENELPVDQHQLLSTIAPRSLYIASAEEDLWADPRGEYLALVAAAPAWKLELPSEPPPSDAPIVVANQLGYHRRSGPHELTKYDWQQVIALADAALK